MIISATLASLIVSNFAIFLSGLGLYAGVIIVAFATVTVHTALRVRAPIVRQAAWMGLGIVGYLLERIVVGNTQHRSR